jgi:hypothetical protein
MTVLFVIPKILIKRQVVRGCVRSVRAVYEPVEYGGQTSERKPE